MFAMCRDGSTVHVFGNTISVSGRGMSETYILCGNMLMGPRGFRSMNCRSIDEAFCLVCGVHGGKNICQQVNCKGVMGAGLAMQIRSQWPVVYQRYLEFCYGNDGNKLGTYQEVLVEPKLYIVNLFGQNGYGRGERQTNYAALATALFSFFRDCAQKNQSAIVRLPYGLGCGLAGGDWDTVLDIISDAAKAWNLNVEIWELQK